MINRTAVRADLKMIIREPILILFLLIPIFIIVVFKFMAIYLPPIIFKFTGIEVSTYYGYVLAFTFMLTPGMLGTVAGFLMIDERDNRIYELMSVTPSGYKGYILNRLMIPFSSGIVYTFLCYYVLNIFHLDFMLLLYIAILGGIEGVIIGLLLFKIAEDKVKGLTYSKALSSLTVFALADVLKTQWVSVIAALSPFYWIVRLITYPVGVMQLIISITVHTFWLGFVIKMRFKK